MLVAALAVSSLCAAAPSRYERSIDEQWSFHKDGSDDVITVDIPHTWNAVDCTDDEPGYWRGVAWYEKTVMVNDNLDGKSVYVRFEGAYQELELFVNGVGAGYHAGGFTAFIFDVTDLIRPGANEFRARVDNSHNDNIPPYAADFTFFGGIYRDVTLLFVPKTHVSVSHYASSGVYVSTPSVSETAAEVRLETHLTVAEACRKMTVSHIVTDPSGKEVARTSVRLRNVKAGPDITDIQTVPVPQPLLWDIDTPRSYSVVTRIEDASGNVTDEVRNIFGIRTFSFDPDKGFSLNGRHIKLIGTNRHQDFKDIGNALPDEMHVRDVRQIKEMGANFLRIAHYPQDPIVSQMCDRLGIVTSVEIPIVNQIVVTPEFRDNCVEMALEMVYQNYNHPSMMIWAYMNEVMIRLPYSGKDAIIGKAEYFDALCSYASAIENAIKKADPLRYSMIPCHNSPDLYQESGITGIPDILGFNLYCGWYTAGLDSFGPTLDRIHSMFPTKSLILTEYGADEDSRVHTFAPERFDYSCEYGLEYHKAHIPVIMEKEYLAGSNVWNINDFYSEARGYAVPHVNLKGLNGLDRVPKDTYWLYKAWLTDKPFVRVGGGDWKIRGGQENAEGVCVQPVEVYSNAETVELIHNGMSLGKKSVAGHTACFDVPFTGGENVLAARASNGAEDLIRVDFRLVGGNMADFAELNVMMGSVRYFEDRDGGIVWIPEQEYIPGSWGYVGGAPMRPKTHRGILPTFEKNIKGTSMDPLFQTQRAGLSAFRADVPDGQYYVYLYFAEIATGQNGKVLPYNLGNDIILDGPSERIFNVSIDGVEVLKDFNMAKDNGIYRAVVKKFLVDVNDGGGIRIEFTPVSGKPAVNAIRIFRCN